MTDPPAAPKLSIGTEKPKRAVVTLYETPPVDPTYSTVLFRVKLADGYYFTVDLSSVDAQRLGNALNSAGGERAMPADPVAAPLADLTAEELVALSHGLRMVPDNTVVGPGFNLLWESEAWKSMWEKVAHAVNTRDDVAPFRKVSDAR